MVKDEYEVLGKYAIQKVDDPRTKELENFAEVYAVYDTEHEIREYETVHYMNCYRFIYDSMVQTEMYHTELMKMLSEDMDEESDIMLAAKDILLPGGETH